MSVMKSVSDEERDNDLSQGVRTKLMVAAKEVSMDAAAATVL